MSRILCAADPSGSVEAIERLLVAADEQDVDAVAMLGDIGERGAGEFDYDELAPLIWTAPAHKGQQRAGSEAVAELIGTHRPGLVVCGSERGVAILGRSTIVAPGSLRDGHYAIADLRERTAVLQQLTVSTVPSRTG